MTCKHVTTAYIGTSWRYCVKFEISKKFIALKKWNIFNIQITDSRQNNNGQKINFKWDPFCVSETINAKFQKQL